MRKSRNETIAFHLRLDYHGGMSKLPPPAACKAAGRPRASDVDERNRNLIRTAGELFVQHGYGKVSLEMIAREAHVAVRTIYVKFGGKTGLLKAALLEYRARFYKDQDLQTDNRPVREIIDEFAEHMHDMIMSPQAISIQRMVLTEAPTNPELAKTFYDTGPGATRAQFKEFFARPDIRAQLRDDVGDPALLTTHLLNCIKGDFFACFLFAPPDISREENRAGLHARLALFYRAVLRTP